MPDVAIILNIDLDHTDCYKDLLALSGAFGEFAALTKELVIINGDDINSSALCFKVRKVSVGLENGCDYRAENLNRDNAGYYSFSVRKGTELAGRFSLSVPGRHNIYNALAAIACADYYGIDMKMMVKALAKFGGVERRFQYLGEVSGARIFTDYAHHPKEIVSSLSTARDMGFGRVTVVFEPHTYTRTASFLEQFADTLGLADEAILLPVYAARELPVAGATSLSIVERLMDNNKNALYKENYTEAIKYLKDGLTENQIIIFMGAGTIDQAAKMMVEK